MIFSTPRSLPVATLLTLALASPAVPQTLTFDGTQTAQTVYGFGAQVWAGDDVGQSVVEDLDLRYIRMQHGVNFFTFPTQPPADDDQAVDNNWQAMRDYIGAHFQGPNNSEPWHLPSIRESFNHAQANGVEVILNEFQIAHSFLNTQNTVMPLNRADDFATFWSAMVDYLDDRGMRPDYLEMANEPDGTWNGRIPGNTYRELVKQTRASLDAHGFADVGIIGPGLSTLGNTTNINALDSDAVDDLYAFSAHTWDDDTGIDARLTEFTNAANAKDPDKPIFITEYATDKFSFNGVNYGDPDQGGDGSDQAAFATQVFYNTLVMINYGVNAPILWEAADQPWSNLTWGLRRGNGTDRPALTAMKTLLDHLPDDAVALEPIWTETELGAAAFIKDDRFIVALANPTADAESRTLTFDHLVGLNLLEALAFDDGQVTSPALTLVGQSVSVTLGAESTLTLVFDFDTILAGLAGDYNGSGQVEQGDLDLVLQNWGVDTDMTGVPAGWINTDGLSGQVDQAELDGVLQNWGAAAAPDFSNAAIPEPLAGGLFAALASRRAARR